MQNDPHIIAVTIFQGSNLIYSTDNWDISGDASRVLSSWTGQNAQFVMVSGVKYSVLQCGPERLFATSLKGEGSIIGSKDDEHKILVYLEPDGEPLGATMDVQRAVTVLSSKSAYVASDKQFGTDTGGAPASGGSSVDPQLKGEIQSFLEWIKDTDGLGGYINYYIQQNNAQIITELAKIYAELRQIFGV